MNKKIDKLSADNIRALSISMVEKAKSGHPGGPMGGADFMHILYAEFLNFDPNDMGWHYRDRFFMDAGHLSTLMYAQYYLLERYLKSELESFRQWGAVTPGHPELDVKRGVENTSGPLGQGHAMGVGAAIAAKFLGDRFNGIYDHKIYSYISDGGIQEEISQGVGRIAGHLGLNNFIMFFDSNDVQLSTTTDEVTSENTAMKYEAWGWNVITIDGYNHDQIRQSLTNAISEKERPTLIIGKTIIGKGCVTDKNEEYEGHCELHGKPIGNTNADYAKTMLHLTANPNDPFKIFDEVKTYYATILKKKENTSFAKKQSILKWKKENPILAKRNQEYIDGVLPPLDFGEIVHQPNLATRESSANILAYLATRVDNLIVSSADLSNSDKTDSFLKKSSVFKKGDFTGAFLQAGVSELTMAALANGMSLHGGVISAVATFFVFSDYMKPAIRMAAIQELPVKYVWTHDSFRVGEDGPTHQPIEHETQIRLMEKIKNHSGESSMIVMRPADSIETTIAWEIALKNVKTPTALILSRQGIEDIPTVTSKSRYEEAKEAKKGGYLVRKTNNPTITLIANGSEVVTLLKAANILETSTDIRVNVASIISEGIFKKQPQDYQESIIPSNRPVFGLTAGLSINLKGLVSDGGLIFGLEHFGYSAPASILDNKFGFTSENISSEILKYLNKQNSFQI